MKFGDVFPENFRTTFFEQNLKRGAVFKIASTQTTPPKLKRIVILGIHQGLAVVGYLFINSEINENVFPTPYLKSLHLPLTATADRQYVEHDSFLDCSHIYEQNLHDLKDKIMTTMDSYLGQIAASDLSQILHLVATARTISPKLKKRYGIIS